jgi:hypothetical protein
MLYLRNTNQQQSLTDSRFGVQRGRLSNITASVTSSCVDYDGSGIIDVNDIVGGKGPLYNYSLYDLSSSVFITQSTTVSSASIEDLPNSTYLLNINNLGLFAYTQSVVVACPNPPDLTVQYLVVGGGDAVYLTGFGGGGGGFLSGSTSIAWNDNVTIEVGAGGTAAINDYGKQSYMSSSLLGMLIASGAIEGQSGLPQGNSAGVGGPYPIGTGGGAGAGQNGIDGTTNASGIGGNGLQWLNGVYYAGGGGGSTNGAGVTNGYGGDGGGGTGAGSPYPTSSVAVNGLGGGAGGQNGNGGSGVVIIRYSTGSVKPAYGGTITEAGGYYYHTFTGSGEFRYANS